MLMDIIANTANLTWFTVFIRLTKAKNNSVVMVSESDESNRMS